MNKYGWVAMTYVRRLRFWIFAACYALALYVSTALANPTYQVVVSANLASIGCCLVALHVRRQFGTPAAHLVPGFAPVHLAVGAVASALAWLVVPALSTVLGVWPPGAVAIHAVPGLLLAVAACWPKAIAVMAAMPITYAFSLLAVRENGTILRVVQGQEPLLSVGMIVAAVAAHAVAARWLAGLADASGPPDEELVLEPSVSHQEGTPWRRWILASRDAAATRLLATAREPLWSVRRWRVPVVVSPLQWLLPVLFAAVMMTVSIWRREATWSFLAMLITACMLFLSPFTAWHWRRRSFASELLLPVTRRDFIRQIAIALAMDVGLWALVASATSIIAIGVLSQLRLMVELPEFLKVYLPLLWGMAIVIYAVALLTIRVRYWVLLITVVGGVWMCAFWPLLVVVLMEFHETFQRDLSIADVYLFSGVSVVLGLVLIGFAYRRLLEAEWR